MTRDSHKVRDARPPAGWEPQADAGEGRPPRGGGELRTVLVVDDEELVRQWICDALGREVRLLTAGSGPEALELLAQEPVAVLVADQRMPRMSGVELLSLVRERYPDTVRLLMTAFREVDDLVAAINQGHVFHFLAKPLGMVELRQALELALRHRRLLLENRSLTEELVGLNRELERTVQRRTEELAEKNQELQSHLLQSERLARFSRRINLLGQERLFRMLVGEIPAALRVDLFSLYLLDLPAGERESAGRLICRSHNHPQGVGEASVLVAALPPGIMRDVFERRVPILVRDFVRSAYGQGSARSKYRGPSCCTLPLMIEEELIALLNLASREGAVFSEDDFVLFTHAAEDLASSISHCVLHQKMQHLAITDGLTGLYNLGHFLERLQEEIDRAQRFASPLSCIMIDLDHFKAINDRCGHDEGNQVLREVARRLMASKRKIDLLARFGGEEFVASLPGTSQAGALEVARRMLESVRVRPIVCRGEPLTVTISLGVATLQGEELSREALIRLADAALYRAKEAGRNRLAGQEPLAATEG